MTTLLISVHSHNTVRLNYENGDNTGVTSIMLEGNLQLRSGNQTALWDHIKADLRDIA
jgi:hypothetical protein